MKNYFYLLFRPVGLLLIFLINFSLLSFGQGFGPKTEARLQAAIDAIQNDPAKSFVGGMSVAIKVDGGPEWQGATGYAARNIDPQNNLLPGGIPFTPNTLSYMYSVTKTFTAALVLELVQEGMFGLDDPISKYLPLNQINPRLNSAATIRQLLAHESGFSDYTVEPQLAILVAAQPTRVWTAAEAISFTNQLFPTGTNRRYSSTNYIILGAMIEAVTQKRLEQHYRERFFNPLGLESMYLGVREPHGNRGLLASPHDNLSPFNPVFLQTGQPTFPNAYTNISRFPLTGLVSLAFSGGGLVSDAKDLAEWGAALFGGRATSKTTLDLMLNSFSATPDVNGNYLGYGIKIIPHISSTEKFLGHNGDAPGYRSVMVHQPERKVTLAVLSNFAGSDPYAIARALYQALAPTITSFSPAAGAPGTTVTIQGEGLSTTTHVIFNGIGATFNIISEDKIEAVVPAAAESGSGKITLLTAGGNVESNADFTVLKRPQTITFPGIGNTVFGVGPIQLRALASSGLRVSYQVVSGPAAIGGSALIVTGAGKIVVRATQPGIDVMQPGVEYAPAEPVEQSFIAEKAPLYIMFTPIADKILGDTPFAIEAIVGSQAGISYPLPITYSIVSGPATISGNMVTLTGVGAVTVRASQAGDANYNPATAEITFNVTDSPVVTGCNLSLVTRVTQAEAWYGMWGVLNGAGAIDLSVQGGTTPYTYRWNAGPATQDITAASPGFYSVTVTDATGCSGMTTVYVGRKNDFLRVLSAHQDASAGGTNGAIDLTVVGGVVPATYQWSNGATTEDLTGLAAGTYTVIVTDAFGRQATTTVVVGEVGAPLTLSSTHQNISAAGKQDGSVDLTVTGGMGPYTYQWNSGAVTEDLHVAVPGDYTVTVTDAMGATATTLVRVEVGRMPITMARRPNVGDDLFTTTAGLTAYPNPVVDRATVNFSLATPGRYTLDLYDLRGSKVKTLASGTAKANQNLTVDVHVAGYAQGVYLLKLVTDQGVASKRLLVGR